MNYLLIFKGHINRGAQFSANILGVETDNYASTAAVEMQSGPE